jgi:tripartite-type tricarboxylate transporter receptor subunit TctC
MVDMWRTCGAYRGGQALLNDLMAGRLDLAIAVLPAALRYAETGRLQILGTLSRTATDMLPVSLGSTLPIGDVSVELWAGLLGPARMDNSAVSLLHAAMASILGNEAYRTERARIGIDGIRLEDPSMLLLGPCRISGDHTTDPF